jgi:hypothetical protein
MSETAYIITGEGEVGMLSLHVNLNRFGRPGQLATIAAIFQSEEDALDVLYTLESQSGIKGYQVRKIRIPIAMEYILDAPAVEA